MENLNFNYYYYLATILIFLVTIFLIKHLFYPVKRLPPSPLSLPIIGHLYLIKSSLHQTLASLSTKYGPVLYLRFGCRNLLVVSSPSAVEECFTKKRHHICKPFSSMAGDKLSFNYKIIIWDSYGYLWRAFRRLTVNIMFSSNSLCKSSALRREEIGIIIRCLLSSSAKINLSSWVNT
uniref:Cytochrome P450 n=1 Tax=Solanum tuberosum TaxID=4113 RepID=M0ZUQ8_SOLTU